MLSRRRIIIHPGLHPAPPGFFLGLRGKGGSLHGFSSDLGNGITTDRQLEEWGKKNIANFYGVINRSDFPRVYNLMKDGDSLIINLDPGYSKGGTHWVALRISSEAPVVFYKDSFGVAPPKDVQDTIKDRGLIYGNKKYQKIKEENCGRRASEFLYMMSDAADKKNEIEKFEQIEGIN